MASWADVVAIGTALPETEESTWYGTPGLKVKGKDALLRSDAQVFFTTPHYDGAAWRLRAPKSRL